MKTRKCKITTGIMNRGQFRNFLKTQSFKQDKITIEWEEVKTFLESCFLIKVSGIDDMVDAWIAATMDMIEDFNNE